MAKNSGIQWTNHTANLWWGCSKVHTGCKNCYAEFLSDTRHKKNLWGEKAGRQRIKSVFNDLNIYEKEAAASGTKAKVFCGSMMDIFEDSKELINPTEEFQNTGDLRRFLFKKIDNGEYNNLIFLFLTKRPENIGKYAPAGWAYGAPKNVWLGTSISDNETAMKFLPIIRKYHPSNIFLSIEPQVGEIPYLNLNGIDWVIQGGESGVNKRPFDIKWAYSMKIICENQKTPYFFKQIDKVQEIPDDLKIQQFPYSFY